MFWRRKRILCPYCLTEIRYRNEIKKCASNKCGEELPIQYVQNYERASPIFVQIIGWSRVGKTTYLQALTLMLMQMGQFWRQNYSYAPLTEATLGYVRNVRQFMESGKMPNPTQLALQDAYMMLLLGMDRWGGRTLVTRDVAGEHFNNLNFPLEYVPYLLHVPTTFLMISPDDLKDSNMAMDDLMNSYIDTMARHDSNFRKQHRKVIVVLSKADKIIDQLPLNLQEYLQNDPMLMALDSYQSVEPLGSAGMQDYMDKLERVSQVIQDWMSKDVRGYNLISLANNNNIELKFTLVSSTGGEVADSAENQETIAALEPTRVLDPYFWALDFQSR